MSKIKVIQPEEATGRLKEIYDELILKRGKIAEVHKIQSLRPESIVKHIDLYMEIMFTKSELRRADREMIAVVVSACNGCEYCQLHHAEALNHYWKNQDRTTNLKKDFYKADLTPEQISLCEYAQELTLRPGEDSENEINKLKQSGFSDNAILDATLVVSYFNFVNRVVLALGVEIENDSGTGYKY